MVNLSHDASTNELATRHDREAERAVLAAVLLDEEGRSAVLARLVGILDEEDFYDPKHATLWRAFRAIHDRKCFIDAVSVAAELQAMARLNAVGTEYLGALVNDFCTFVHCETHAEIVARHAAARRIQFAAERLRAVAADFSSTQDEMVAAARGALDEALSRQRMPATDFHDALLEEFERICSTKGDLGVRPTGIDALDRALCGGLREGELFIPGGRPSSGKSALVLQVAVSIAKTSRLPVVFVSLEMPRDQVVQRVTSAETGIDLARIRARTFTQDEVDQYIHASQRLQHLPLLLVEDGGITPARLRALCLRTKMQAPGGRLGVVVVDYLQRMRADVRAESREQEIAEVARSLKRLALELRCPVIAPAQLNRALEGREDAPPRMSDFRGSGEIEQEADILLGIHRPKKAPHRRELWVLKQRNGPSGTRVGMEWEAPCARFTTSTTLPGASDDYPSDGPREDWS